MILYVIYFIMISMINEREYKAENIYPTIIPHNSPFWSHFVRPISITPDTPSQRHTRPLSLDPYSLQPSESFGTEGVGHFSSLRQQ